MMTYYDVLTHISNYALFLRRAPVPADASQREEHLKWLQEVYATMELIATECAPEVWVGDPNDVLRQGRPLAPGHGPGEMKVS